MNIACRIFRYLARRRTNLQVDIAEFIENQLQQATINNFRDSELTIVYSVLFSSKLIIIIFKFTELKPEIACFFGDNLNLDRF